MEKTNFTTEELNQIKELQEKYNSLGIQLVQLTLSINNAKEYLASLQEQKENLTQEILQTNEKEKKLAQFLDEKYGAGSLNMETGEFTSKTS